MKRKLVLSTAFLLTAVSNILVAPSVSADTLETKSYIVIVNVQCEEGEVTCENVLYSGESKISGNKIELVGKTVHSICADGVTPCMFRGYSFKNGDVNYFVSVFGDLEVWDAKGNVLVDESGEWK
ncbi:hypothetical protein [Vibrio intestinalis]|uniref:hypothetical protein n=1 Tax=Vibrio intestinalis TaxID=2933291 RepID=UPI0021A7F7F0|nr:hypothetical protein [Vibrio intestinalis]